MNLKKLLGLCDHKFVNVRQYDLLAHEANPPFVLGKLYILRCEKCGILKHKKVVV